MTDRLAGLHQGADDGGVIVRTACVACDAEDAVERLRQALQPDDLEIVVIFFSPRTDIAAFVARLGEGFAGTRLVGCTTAGEITQDGYAEGTIMALGFPRSHFSARSLLIDDLDNLDSRGVVDGIIRNRNGLAAEVPRWQSEFSLLLVDGLSTCEDQLTAEISFGLGPVPLSGGSAGDGTDFARTFVLFDGKVASNAAVLIQMVSRCPIRVFKTDHLVPAETRMVVTGADPSRRVVSEINAEPAAREYARILGKDPEQLSPFIFAAHPVVVQFGGQHHVRAIQRVADNGDLVFFSAIDEGVVLTLAEPDNMVDHLEREMQALSEGGKPDAIIAFDCILRRLEAEQKQQVGQLSRILADNRVVGFSTYGEQYNSMHVNQTLTGVAIYPPDEG
ncbi:FIST N-terminal domain-containing protein [uncultured Cohaesibacter sp.]|uniref:FIST N-terminal domain-containing protein n=1 Tax=uncultured Cohaesibacter sp. TaxID=1002546 RepID=UPI0029C857F9|nr:FIST N-terminal domain-containing protein [uncultured Cohaesibacter sp.]